MQSSFSPFFLGSATASVAARFSNWSSWRFAINLLRSSGPCHGHLPFMSKLVSALVAGDEEAPMVAFQPGSMVCVERDSEGRWQIVWMIRPDTLG